jgi:hypothetical protein
VQRQRLLGFALGVQVIDVLDGLGEHVGERGNAALGSRC